MHSDSYQLYTFHWFLSRLSTVKLDIGPIENTMLQTIEAKSKIV